jgi:lipid II:glycine glycyltransferase (peptidoglycan interpeptide bridge formation enzyme)
MNFGIEAAATTISSTTKVAFSAKTEPCAARVHEFNPLCDSRWDAFVNRHPQGSVFHSTNWLRALQTTYGYDPVVVTTCAGNTPLTNGLVFCRIKSWLTGRRFVSLPFSDHCEPLVNNSDELDDLLLHMKRYVDADKWKYIEIRPTSCLAGSQAGLGRSITYCFHCLDLRKSTQELFRNFHKDCVQRKIRRAEREKLHYESGNSEILLQKFYDLLVITRRRQCLPPQPLSWFRGLVAAFGEDLKIRLASKDDMPIASILTLVHKKSMVYKYGCSDARFHSSGGMALLFWKAIQEAKDKGYEEFELGRSDSGNRGLISFKEHWGTVGTELNYWTYPLRPAADLTKRHKAFLRLLVPLAPNFVLKTIGGLLYGHTG